MFLQTRKSGNCKVGHRRQDVSKRSPESFIQHSVTRSNRLAAVAMVFISKRSLSSAIYRLHPRAAVSLCVCSTSARLRLLRLLHPINLPRTRQGGNFVKPGRHVHSHTERYEKERDIARDQDPILERRERLVIECLGDMEKAGKSRGCCRGTVQTEQRVDFG